MRIECAALLAVLCASASLRSEDVQNVHVGPRNDVQNASVGPRNDVQNASVGPRKDDVVWRSEDVAKSDRDTKTYRALRLANDMRVLLVSDAHADKAAAAVDVHVGSNYDPADVPGTAHFTEHLLFMGTARYPDENEYASFLAHHGGHSNAYTDAERTNYYFDVDARHLAGALDRFASFFVAPLFREDGVARELEAVHSEHAKNVDSDLRRVAQVAKHEASRRHPYHHFATGSRETLRVPGIRERVVAFYDAHYSANVMCAVVVGREGLDELEALAAPRLGAVRNSHASLRTWDAPPLGAEHLGRVLAVQTLKDVHRVTLSWQLPDMRGAARTKPLAYASHLFGHESAGSVLSVLRAKAWATALAAGGEETRARGHAFFDVRVTLGEEGAAHVPEVVQTVLAYARMLRDAGPQRALWDEEQRLRTLAFRFAEHGAPASFASGTAARMHDYGALDVLRAPTVADTYDADAIARVLAALADPANMRVIVEGRTLPAHCGQTLTEPWYGTAYCVHPRGVAEMLAGLAPLSARDTAPEMHLPHANPFVPRELLRHDPLWVLSPLPPGAPPKAAPDVLLSDGETDRTANEGAERLKTAHERLWHKQDDTFAVPKSCLQMQIRSAALDASARDAVLARLWAQMVADAVAEVSYDASVAGIDAALTVNAHGASLAFCGYSERMSDLVAAYIGAMARLPATHATRSAADTLAVFVAAYRRKLEARMRETPVSVAAKAAHAVLRANVHTPEERLAVLAAFVPGVGSVLKTDSVLDRDGALDRNSALDTDGVLNKGNTLNDSVLDTGDTLKDSALDKDGQFKTGDGVNVGGRIEAWGLEDVLRVGERVFAAADVETLVHGDLPAERAHALYTAAIERLRASYALEALAPATRTALAPLTRRLPPRTAFVLAVPDVPSTNSAVDAYWQVAEAGDTHGRALAMLLAQVFREPFFDELRTKQQLGYIVHLGYTEAGAASMVRMVVQSERTPPEIAAAIAAFVAAMAARVESMSDDAFRRHADALAARLTARKKSLVAETAALWSEVARGQYDFEWHTRVAERLASLTRADLAAFVRERVQADGAQHSLLAIHLWSETSKLTVPEQYADAPLSVSQNNESAKESVNESAKESINESAKESAKEIVRYSHNDIVAAIEEASLAAETPLYPATYVLGADDDAEHIVGPV